MSATPATTAEVLADASRANTLEEAALRKILPNTYASNISLTDPAFQAYMRPRPIVRLQVPTTSYTLAFTTTEKVVFNWTVTPRQSAGSQYYSYIVRGRMRVATDGTNTFKFRFTGFSDQFIHYRALNSDNTVTEASLTSLDGNDPWSGAIGGAGITETVILIEGLLESHTGNTDITAGFSLKADTGNMLFNNAGFLELSIA